MVWNCKDFHLRQETPSRQTYFNIGFILNNSKVISQRLLWFTQNANKYKTIAELTTITINTKLFTTLWIVQNHTNTAHVTQILVWVRSRTVGVCCPLVDDCYNRRECQEPSVVMLVLKWETAWFHLIRSGAELFKSHPNVDMLIW